MGKVAVPAAVGLVVAGVLLVGVVFGAQLPPAVLMSIAAAVWAGAGAAVLTRYAIDHSKEKPRGSELLGKRIRDVKGLVSAFPTSNGALLLSIKTDTVIDELDVVRHPSAYANREIVVTLRASGKPSSNPGANFNPVTLKRLFVALKDQPNFLHVILIDSDKEFVGYIPGFRAKAEFTGGNAEGQIVKYIIDVLTDHAKSANLHQIDGLSSTDIISDEATLQDAQTRMQGGFHRLVVLRGGRHKNPSGLLFSEQLLAATNPKQP